MSVPSATEFGCTVVVIVTSPRFVIVPVPLTSPESVITESLLIDTAPDVTVKSVALNEATPLFVSVASSAETVIVLFVTATSIPSPPATVNVSVKRLTVSVPVSPAIDRFVATSVSDAAVKRPCASTVNDGIFVCEPYEPAVTAVLSKSIVSVPAASLYVDVKPTPPTIAEPITS